MPAPAAAKRIEMWPLERLVPYERNARTHSPEQVAQIAASIQEFGFTNPILVDGADGILAGHGRLAAARDMGLAEAPVIVLDHLNADQRRAYILADNQLALNAGWDTELLQIEVAALNLADFDLSLLGFDDDRIASLLDPDGIDREGDGPPSGADDQGKTYEQRYAVAVECASETEQETVYEKLNGEGYACRLLTV
jgi:ParB-like chromosome segregation protein Spo0J